ncbi:MAG: c-type cytochrome [Alphaproteobacteria bacterium]
MRFQKLAIVLMAVGLLAACATENSPADPKASIEARKDLMHSILADLKVVVAYIKGKNDDAGLVANAAKGISAKASKIPEVFKAKVHVGNAGALKTTAKPLIWSNWGDFTQAASNLKASADGLANGAATGDWKAIEAGFEAVEKSCGACHKSFRVKKAKK